MPSPTIPYAVGRVRILENMLLTDQQLLRLRELPYADAVRQLTDWGYAADYPVRDDVDALVEFRRQEMRAIVADVTPDARLTDLFRLPEDATNLKYLIKARLLGEDAPNGDLQPGVYGVETLAACVAARDYGALGGALAARMDAVEALIGGATAPREISAAVDRAVYEEIFAELRRRGDALCRRYFIARVDFTNILSLLRARALGWTTEALEGMLLDHGAIPPDTFRRCFDLADDRIPAELAVGEHADLIRKTLDPPLDGGVNGVSGVFSQRLLAIVEADRYDSFGIGPVAYFLLRAEEECRAMRVLFARKRAARASQGL